jgi:hypothetical protein
LEPLPYEEPEGNPRRIGVEGETAVEEDDGDVQ